MLKKLSIVHFQPLERYPPIMNLINSLEKESFESLVLTTHHAGGDWFDNIVIQISRLGNAFGSKANRYFCYLQFVILGLLKLVKFKPDVILYYESYSVFPVFLYVLVFPKVTLLIHYHEFESTEEKRVSSNYSKLLSFFELKLLNRAIWISNTNVHRLNMFHEYHSQLNAGQLKIFPNYPSKCWTQKKMWELSKNSEIVKFIHVGSLGIETTYISEFIEWIQTQNGRTALTVVSQNLEQAVIDLINENQWVTLIPNIPYQELPEMIVEHDIGVVLYTGHVPNFIYNVPNKVNEYLACGLNVWYSDVLISTQKFAEENPQYPLYSVDFSKGKNLMAPEFSSEPFEFKHWHEDAVKPLIYSIKQAMDSSLNTF